MSSNGFISTTVTTVLPNSKSLASTLFLGNTISAINRQLHALQHFNSLDIRPTTQPSNQAPVSTSPLHTPFFRSLYSKKRAHVISNCPPTTFWNDYAHDLPRSFVSFLQVFTDKTASSLSSTAFTAYPIHVVVLNTTPERREWLINNGLTIVGFLPASTVATEDIDYETDVDDELRHDDESLSSTRIPLDDHVELTSDTDGRESSMRVLHSCISYCLSKLESISVTGQNIVFPGIGSWNWFPLLCSYCCDIPEAKNIFTVKHGNKCTMPCIRCTAPQTTFNTYSKESPRHSSDTIQARQECLDLSNSIRNLPSLNKKATEATLINKQNDILDMYSLANWPSFLENNDLVPRSVIENFYDIYTFEALHDLYLGTSTSIKRNVFFYLISDRIIPINNRMRKMSSLRSSILRGCNTILRFFQSHSFMPGTRIDFSKKDCSSQLNGIYTSTGLRGMLEGKDYKALDTVFPFVFAYVDIWLQQETEASLTSVHVNYTDLVQQIMSDNNGLGWSEESLSSLEDRISSFKQEMSDLFHKASPTGIGTLKFHLLDHIVHDIRCFGSIRMLTASPFEHFNTHIKSAYASTSGRVLSRDAETVATLAFNLSRRVLADTTSTIRSSAIQPSPDVQQFGLVSQGHSLPLHHFVIIHGKGPTPCKDPFLHSFQKTFPPDAFNQLSTLLQNEVDALPPSSSPNTAQLNIVQSGYIDGGFVPSLSDCQAYDGLTVLKAARPYATRRQRVFGISWDRPRQARKQSFVVMKGVEEDNLDTLWVGHVLLLFHLKGITNHPAKEYAFVQFMEVTSCLTKVDEVLGCVCLRWATDDNIDHTLDPSTHIRAGHIETAEWYGLVPFDSLIGTVQVLRANIPISPFTSPIPWPLHRFHVNRFYVNKDPLLQ